MLEDLEIDLFAFLGVLEFALVVTVVAVIFLVRSKSLAARVQQLERNLLKAQDAPDTISFDQYLRDEVLRNQDLVERASASEDDEDRQRAELFALRKKFLELEIDAHSLENNPVEFETRLAAGMGELIELLRPAPETLTETVTEQDVSEDSGEEDALEQESSGERATIDTHDEEVQHLKDVINNQQDALANLRQELQARESEIEDLDSILQKLDEFENQSAQLQQCMAVLEQENQRLKEARGSDEHQVPDADSDESAQLDGLKSMVGEQQSAISRLQQLIQQLAPEAGQAKELRDAIEGMRRANQELNGCVVVLEDENAMLRRELEEMQARLAAPETPDAADTLSAVPEANSEQQAPEAAQSPDEEKQQLEIKVQELEALVEFKDAAIEELEKQYSKLEARYLGATGGKNPD